MSYAAAVLVRLSRREVELVVAALANHNLRLNPDDQRLVLDMHQLLDRELAPTSPGQIR